MDKNGSELAVLLLLCLFEFYFIWLKIDFREVQAYGKSFYEIHRRCMRNTGFVSHTIVHIGLVLMTSMPLNSF